MSSEARDDIHSWSAPQCNHQNLSHGDYGDDQFCDQNTFGDGDSTVL